MKNRQQASELTDEQILQYYKEDADNEWIGVLFDRYAHLLLGLCLKYLKRPEDARDCVQQIFLKIMRELPRHDIQYFKGWIYQVGRNHCLMRLRNKDLKYVYDINEELLPEANHSSKQEVIQKEQLISRMEAAMEQLKEEQQKCIRLFYLQKKSYQEVAEATGYNISQVKSYIQNGKRNLRLMLEGNK